MANMAPKRTRYAVESSASSAERNSPKKASFPSQLQKWVKDEGVIPDAVVKDIPAKRKATRVPNKSQQESQAIRGTAVFESWGKSRGRGKFLPFIYVCNLMDFLLPK